MIGILKEDLKIRDLTVEGRGIFYYVNQLEPITEIIDADILDLGFQMLHGNKKLSPFINAKIINNVVTETTLEDIAKVIVMMFSSKWNKSIKLYFEEMGVDSFKRIITEDITDTGVDVSTRLDTSETEREEQKASFDSDLYSNEGKETNTSNLNSTDEIERSKLLTRNKTETGSATNRLSDIRNYKNLLQEDVINDIVYIDVSRLIGLSIY